MGIIECKFRDKTPEIYMKFLTLMLLASLVYVAACSTITSIDERGRRQTKYFQSEWDWFTAGVEQDIQAELSGKQPPGRERTWQQYWEWRIGSIESLSKEPEKKVNFIRQKRTEAGLPDVR